MLHEYKEEETEHILRLQIGDNLTLKVLDCARMECRGGSWAGLKKQAPSPLTIWLLGKACGYSQNQKYPVPMMAAINPQSGKTDKHWIQQDWLSFLLVGRIPRMHSILKIFYALWVYCKYEILYLETFCASWWKEACTCLIKITIPFSSC